MGKIKPNYTSFARILIITFFTLIGTGFELEKLSNYKFIFISLPMQLAIYLFKILS
jgi:hypothetical protein